MPTEPNVTTKRIQRAFGGTLDALGKGLAVSFFASMVIAVGIYAYRALDKWGGITHNMTLDVVMTPNWFVGENRLCWLHQELDKDNKPTGKFDSLDCRVGDEPEQTHNVRVAFKGVVSSPDLAGDKQAVAIEWKCTRKEESFACEPFAYPSGGR